MSDMFNEALVLMGAGMGTVSFFLVVMVGVMYLSAYLLRNTVSAEMTSGKKSLPGRDDLTQIAIAVAAAKRRND
jgi:Na+-transporting methylmalonyl-CoA/oxaloacetate decarboxylase gamma subunit